jgi:endonuclease-3 related protein
MRLHEKLSNVYEILNEHFGELNWWPGETPFEVAVGAILTQNTNWKNVEIAISRLKAADLLDPLRLYAADDNIVADLIRPSGYYNVKTKRLKAFLLFLQESFEGRMELMFEEEPWALRRKLLNVSGIGEETADSILLYSVGKPVFVVDAYTRRILERHNIVTPAWSYKEIQSLFMDNLPRDASLYNKYHALLVNTGKYFCRRAPLCSGCPLDGLKPA